MGKSDSSTFHGWGRFVKQQQAEQEALISTNNIFLLQHNGDIVAVQGVNEVYRRMCVVVGME